MKTIAKLAAVLFPLVAACGGATSTNAKSVAETECSLTVRAATAAELRQAVSDVLDGVVDPCGGAVKDLRSRNISLERIDSGVDADNSSVYTLVFRVSGNDLGPLQPK